MEQHIKPLLALALSLAALGCATPVPHGARYEVRSDCAARANCYASITAALAAADQASEGWALIDIGPGDYYEKPTISRPRTHLRGAGADNTRLHFDAVAESAGRYHRAHWGTPGSATLTINADEVTIERLTVENTFDFLANDALVAEDPNHISNSQGVALLLDIHSDRVLIQHAALLGYQDTLFANGARALIRDSVVAGNVDFIFGNGQVLIEDSTIRSRRRAALFAPGEFQSFIAAPSTQLAQRMGIVFYRARLTREAGVPDNSVALARPWHPTTTFPDGRYADPNAVGQASFIDCFMDAHIHEDHWASMNGTARDGTKTAVFTPQSSRFAESGSHGPGARHNNINIDWREPLDIDEVHRIFFVGWSQARS